jgi:hypothetical protein
VLPYTVGDRHIFLGAVAPPARSVPADDAALARAVAERPMPLDLVLATEFGAWERFGELLLTGPARDDDSAPLRFDPTRHPIPGLPPAGMWQRIGGPTYSAVQRVAGPADEYTL